MENYGTMEKHMIQKKIMVLYQKLLNFDLLWKNNGTIVN